MMLDKYLGFIADNLDSPTRSFAPVDITEAVRMFFEDTRGDVFDWARDFPTIVSPWPMTWYEWKTPTHYQTDGVLRAFDVPGMSFGALVACVRLDPRKSLPSLKQQVESSNPGWSFNCEDGLDNAPRETVCWLQQARFFGEFPGRSSLAWCGETLMYLNESGLPTSSGGVGHLVSDGYDELLPTTLMTPLAFAISLLHCKNVRLINNDVPEKLQRARARRNKPPKFVYKTLIIEPMKRILRTEGQSQTLGLKRALHICRGHFKDYRDRGLFGSEQHKGIYWWDMHVRGTTEVGVVIKDYKVGKGVTPCPN